MVGFFHLVPVRCDDGAGDEQDRQHGIGKAHAEDRGRRLGRRARVEPERAEDQSRHRGGQSGNDLAHERRERGDLARPAFAGDHLVHVRHVRQDVARHAADAGKAEVVEDIHEDQQEFRAAGLDEKAHQKRQHDERQLDLGRRLLRAADGQHIIEREAHHLARL